MDLRLFVENSETVAKTLLSSLNDALDKVKPNVDVMVEELSPEAKTLVKEAVKESREKLAKEQER